MLLFFDPLDPPPGAWPVHSDARPYIEAMAAAGVETMIPNVQTRWMALRSGNRLFPVTINDGAIGDSYVCLPHSAYIRYARAELDIVNTGLWAPVLRLLIHCADFIVRAGAINRIIHIDNWLLSTNLHGDWAGDDLPAIRALLIRHYPDHVLAIRSVDPWSSPQLLQSAQQGGWILLPSRQIWVTNDLESEWRRQRDTRTDQKLLNKSGLRHDEFTTMTQADAARIAALYHMLYIGKYSPLNPVFSADYVLMTWRIKLIHYRGVRDKNGHIVAIAGSLIRGDILTPPVVGYDTSWPQTAGLYRIATLLFTHAAADANLRLNGSAGAAQFKRNRGAKGVIEYTVIAAAHLSWKRRLMFAFMRFILHRIAVPIMKRHRL